MSDKLGIVNKPPYFDDFDREKNYSKILFRPGRAVQSRELTQIQSLLQNQIASLGDKFITSPIVSGGDFQIGTVKFLKFRSEEDVSYLKGKLGQLTLGDNTCKFRIVEVKELTDDFTNADVASSNNWVIFFDYTNGFELTDVSSLSASPINSQELSVTIIDEQEAEQTTFVFSILGIGEVAYSVLTAAHQSTTTGISVYGNALLARLGAGVLYKKGYFIVNDVPLILPIFTKTFTNTDCIYENYAPSIQDTKILLKLVSSYVSSDEDPTLFDPSAGYYNYAAPGADRLQITPSLTQSIDESDMDSIHIATIVDGETRIEATVPNNAPLSIFQTDKDCQDQILKPFILDIIGTTLYVNSGRAVVNCTDIEIIESQSVSLSSDNEPRRLFNQPLNQQCLSDAIIVQSNFDTPLFGGVSGVDYTSVNTNYYGSGKITKLFSDEAPRLEIVNCSGIKIGCLTLLDISENDSTSYRLYYNELQSYVSTISESELFAEACTLSLNGEKVFTIESTIPLTCSDTLQGANRRLVYKIPKGTNIENVFDSDYMITRDFVANISTKSVRGLGASTTTGTVAEFSMDIPNGVFNDGQVGEEAIIGSPDLFTVVVNGKVVPLKQQRNAPYVLVESKSKITVVLDRADEAATSEDGDTLTMPTAGKCYLIAKVRFPEKGSTRTSVGVSDDTIPHRKKILKEARGSYVHNFSIDSTLSLGFSDIYKIKSITDGSGTDITTKFVFDDGQRNDRYDHGSIAIDPNELISVIGSDTSSKEYVIEFQYFEHIPIAPGFYGPITINSYGFDKNGAEIASFHGLGLNGSQLTLGYDEIPNFLDRVSGEVISLSDAIDFRMVRTEEGLIENNVSKSAILRGRWFPSPDSSAAVELSYALDLPRIDLLILKEDGNMIVLQGEPSSNPIPREYPKDGCVIAEIKVPGKILSSEDFIVQKTPIKSVSLSELNDMQNRLAELEKAVSIKTLENKARIQSASLQNEFLTGMVVDDFGGHYVGDVSNDEYNCSMDFSKGVLRSPFTTAFYDFVPSSGYPTSGLTAYFATATAKTNGVTLIENDQGTSEVSVNGFGVADWHGYLSLDRPTHLWVDQTTKPIVRNNKRGQNDAWESGGECVQANGRNKGFGTQWAFWRSLWFGDSIFEELAIEKDRASSKGFSDAITNIAPSRFSRSINREELFSTHKKTIANGGFALTDPKSSKYVDSALTFFSPENYIIVRGHALKPNTTYSLYFDNMSTPVSLTKMYTLSLGSLSEIRTDSEGSVEFVLKISGGSYITGNKVIKLLENTSSSKPSYASTIYQNIGSEWKNRVITEDDSVETEMLPIGRSDIFVQNEKTLYTENTAINGIYQTFFIDKGEYSHGLVLDKVSVYFSQIDSNDIPVVVEVRKIINGKVDTNYIVRNSRVQTTPSATGYTDFTFSLPVYLAAGDYALVVKTISSNYKVHVSQRGNTRLDNGVVDSQEAVFATSSYGAIAFFNGSAFGQAGDSATTLRFNLHRKSFNTGTTTFELKPRVSLVGGANTESKFDLLYLANNNWQTTTGNVKYELSTANGRRTIASNTDIEESDTLRTDSSKIIVTLTTTREDISPIVDIRKLGALCVKNRISTTTDVSEDREILSFGGSAGSAMKYITRRTDLDLPANTLRATLEAKIPSDFELKLYAKVVYEGDQDFDNNPYKPMRRIFGASSSAKDQFRELIFELDDTDSSKSFISFSVKVIMLSNMSDSTTQAVEFYPELRNLTIVSTVK